MKYIRLTNRELNLVNFKLAADNNAMLRMLLENQLKIMDQIGISDPVSKFSFESVCSPVVLLPKAPISIDKLSRVEFESNITAANIISTNIRHRSREWVKESQDK